MECPFVKVESIPLCGLLEILDAFFGCHDLIDILTSFLPVCLSGFGVDNRIAPVISPTIDAESGIHLNHPAVRFFLATSEGIVIIRHKFRPL